MMSRQLIKCRGITLLELMVALVVLAILVTIAAPSLTQLIHTNRIVAQNNEFVSLLNLAKSQAVRRNASYEVIIDFGSPWEIDVRRADFVSDPDEDPVSDGCLTGAIRCMRNERSNLTGSTNRLVFDQRGYLTPINDGTRVFTIAHTPCQGDRQARELRITATGQVTSLPIPCP